jgi:hypothetical protein
MAAPRAFFGLSGSRSQRLAKGKRRKATKQKTLRCEALEDRRMMAGVYQYDSLSDAPVALYLNFEGAVAHDWDSDTRAHGPGGDNVRIPTFALDGRDDVDGTPDLTGIEASVAERIRLYVAEKFSPFQINVTTRSPGVLHDGISAAVIVGGQSAHWFDSATGVAQDDSFTSSSPFVNHAFAFSETIAMGIDGLNVGPRGSEQWLTRFVRAVGETIAHEAGHMFGLDHQSDYNATNMLVEVYGSGDGLYIPIMGNSDDNVSGKGVWYNGKIGPMTLQDDIATMTRPETNIRLRTDDHGEWTGSGSLNVNLATGAASGKGIIERLGDIDGFSFTAIGRSVEITALAPEGGMLSPDLELVIIGNGDDPVVNVTRQFNSATLSANVIPGRGYILRVKGADNHYGNLGQYQITADLGGFAELEPDGTLLIRGYATESDNIMMRYDVASNRIVVQNTALGGGSAQLFHRSLITNIRIMLDADNNHVSLLDNLDGLPVFYGSTGVNNGLYLTGTTGDDVFTLNDQGTPWSSVSVNGSNVTYTRSTNRLEMSGFGGNDKFNISNTPRELSLRIDGMDGFDEFYLAPNDPFGMARINGPVTIFGSAGDDTLHIGSGNADAVGSNIVFYGGSGDGPLGDAVVIHDEAINYGATYDVGPIYVTRSGLATQTHTLYDYERLIISAGSTHDQFNVRNGLIATLEAFGNGGDDRMSIGQGHLTSSGKTTFEGGAGIDTLTLDDHLNPDAQIFDVVPGKVKTGGIIALKQYSTVGADKVAILAGAGVNEITFDGTLEQAFDVDAGAGDDVVIFGRTAAAHLRGAVNVHAGAGNDSFVWQNKSDNYWSMPSANHVAPVSLDGGSDDNGFYIDETTQAQMAYTLYADRVVSNTADFFPTGMDVNFANMQTMSLDMGSHGNFVNVYGTSFDIDFFSQFTVRGGDGADELTLYPHDDAGNRTIHGNLGFGGGAGADLVKIDNWRSAVGLDVTFYNQHGPSTTNISGLGSANFGVGADVEKLEAWGSGDSGNTFRMNTHAAPTQFDFMGGFGVDTIDYMNWAGPGLATADVNVGTGTGVSSLSWFDKVRTVADLDMNQDGVINGADLAAWRSQTPEQRMAASVPFDFLAWQRNLGKTVALAAPTAAASSEAALAAAVVAADEFMDESEDAAPESSPESKELLLFLPRDEAFDSAFDNDSDPLAGKTVEVPVALRGSYAPPRKTTGADGYRLIHPIGKLGPTSPEWETGITLDVKDNDDVASHKDIDAAFADLGGNLCAV